VHISSKKLYLDSIRGYGGGCLAAIFFSFLFCCFQLFSLFWKLIRRGRCRPYKLFLEADVLPSPKNSISDCEIGTGAVRAPENTVLSIPKNPLRFQGLPLNNPACNIHVEQYSTTGSLKNSYINVEAE
jgi:hypothetical protein